MPEGQGAGGHRACAGRAAPERGDRAGRRRLRGLPLRPALRLLRHRGDVRAGPRRADRALRRGPPGARAGTRCAAARRSFTLRDVLGLRGFPPRAGAALHQPVHRPRALAPGAAQGRVPARRGPASRRPRARSSRSLPSAPPARHLAAGRLAQRWPAERLLLVGLLVGGLPCALMALAPGWQSLMSCAASPVSAWAGR